MNATGEPHAYPSCLRGEGECDLVLVDVTGDGKPEIILLGNEQGASLLVMSEDKTGNWLPIGSLPWRFAQCKPLRQKLIEGQFKVVAPAISDLEIAGIRIPLAAPPGA